MSENRYYADLHIHSHWSDGTCSPKEIAQRAAEKNLSYICLTDIMNLDEWIEFSEVCKEYGLKTDPALELQTFYKNDWVGLFLYGKKVFHKSFSPFIEQARRASDVVVLLYAGYLRSQGIIVSKSEIDDFFKTPNERTWSLYHINEYLRRVHHIPPENIGRLIRNAHLRHVDRFDIYREWLPRLEDILNITSKLKILSCYAYPGVTAERRRKMQGTSQSIELQKIINETLALKKIGLNAIEVRYSEHSVEVEKILLKHATTNNFIVIGGSGFHGDQEVEHKPGVTIGIKGITKTEYEMYKRKI